MTFKLARLLLFAAFVVSAPPAQAEPVEARSATLRQARGERAHSGPRRIVSLNLCADQYLLALADPGQIAALGRFARDPAMSFAAGKARAFPVTRGNAEDVLLLRPDLILVGLGYRSDTLAAIGGRGIRIVELPPASSYGEIVAQVRMVAREIGHPARGEALIRRMDAELAQVSVGLTQFRSSRAKSRDVSRTRSTPTGAEKASGPVAAYYQRRGYLTGTGTLVDEMMRRVGLRNLAASLDRPVLSRLSVEEMVAARPDYLIVENRRVVDRGTEMLRHPALAAIPRIYLPEAWTVCGGPSYPFAVRRLAEQLSPPAPPLPLRGR
jgi:iron complex transport system substrate-binding protein